MHKKIFLTLFLFTFLSGIVDIIDFSPQSNSTSEELTYVSDIDLVKQFIYYLSKKDYLSAYSLKLTDKSFEDFKTNYSSLYKMYQKSFQELEDGNVKVNYIIDNLPYERVFEVVDKKIKTISSKALDDFVFEDKELIKFNKENLYYNEIIGQSSIKFHNGLYQVLYYPENDSKLDNEKIILASNVLLNYNYYIDSTPNDLLNLSSIKRDKQYYKWNYDESSKPLYVENNKFKYTSIEDINGRKVIVQNYTNGNKFYIFAERLDKNNVAIYTGFNSRKNFHSKNDLIKLFKNLEEKRLEKYSVGDCYSHQGNLNCIMEDKNESIRFTNLEYNKRECYNHKKFILDCFKSLDKPRKIFFLKPKIILNLEDIRYSDNLGLYAYIHFPTMTKGGVDVFSLYKEENSKKIEAVIRRYDIYGDLNRVYEYSCKNKNKLDYRKCIDRGMLKIIPDNGLNKLLNY